MGADEDDEDESEIPEEEKVKGNSRQLVLRAQSLLGTIHPETISAIRSKQTARTVLSKEQAMIHEMVNEGLLTAKHAEEFLDEITTDTLNIEEDRMQKFRKNAGKSELIRQQGASGNEISPMSSAAVFAAAIANGIGGASSSSSSSMNTGNSRQQQQLADATEPLLSHAPFHALTDVQEGEDI